MSFLTISTKQVELTVERHFCGYYVVMRFDLITRKMEQIGAETCLKRVKKLAVELMKREPSAIREAV